MSTVIFPKWTNKLPAIIALKAVFGSVAVVFVISFWFSPEHTDVGYAPVQPVAYSHKLHAGLLGIDCRYCHQNVEHSPHATVPATETCLNCHAALVKPSSARLEPVRDSGLTGDSIPWVKVHMLPDYAYFDHSLHLNAGVGCSSCHGRIDKMEVVRQTEPLSMSWCLDCHRAPEKHLRPKKHLTLMDYEDRFSEAERVRIGSEIKKARGIDPPTHCSACHR